MHQNHGNFFVSSCSLQRVNCLILLPTRRKMIVKESTKIELCDFNILYLDINGVVIM